ncbi:coenzyme F420-0:L-glutamate ligase [Candidatus Nitrosotenuis cloacae]|uniref:coenzyme F420-0:L-glutamate ligase n=1 Tax=Candidatus Nitrosotenuis cloacae TaxID=1603555 RepID=UPI00227F52C3|nr:coenzyme F420-0:L-glutamate ligase [Candidatus Nitrosotenuis cloacae]
MSFAVIPLRVEKKDGPFDLYRDLVSSLGSTRLDEGDVIVISSKYIANSQNRIIDMSGTVPSDAAVSVAGQYKMDPKFAEIILRESDRIFGGVSGFVLTSSDEILAPNAGIDKSNVKKGKVVLYPDESYLVSEQLRRKLFLDLGIHVGIIVVDSRLMPARAGTIGVTIACAGFEPIQDMRGQKDLDGNPLKVTLKATADNIASIANHKMGEGAESTPIAIVKGSGAVLTDRRISPGEMTVSSEMCVYIRGFQNKE